MLLLKIEKIPTPAGSNGKIPNAVGIIETNIQKI